MKRLGLVSMITSVFIFSSGCSYDMYFTAKSEIDILINSSKLNIISIVVNPINELRS